MHAEQTYRVLETLVHHVIRADISLPSALPEHLTTVSETVSDLVICKSRGIHGQVRDIEDLV